MIVCPNCNHQNPDGAVQCEACYTPLPNMMDCPSCGASVQSDASFCGQCGFDLRGAAASVSVPPTITPGMAESEPSNTSNTMGSEQELSFDPVTPDPLVEPEPLVGGDPAASAAPPVGQAEASAVPDPLEMAAPDNQPEQMAPSVESPPGGAPAATQLQLQTAKLLHVQTDTTLELPAAVNVIHIGKPNDRVPPDIDVAGFPNSEIVSRIHADIRVEGDVYYIEDVGSSNGTYINNSPLPTGNRHRLRPGDRISLGKGDQVTFLFQFS